MTKRLQAHKLSRNECGFTLLETLLVLAITLVIIAVTFSIGYKKYEEASLERYAAYIEMKIREMQLFSIEHELSGQIKFDIFERQVEYFYYNKHSVKFDLYKEPLPFYVRRVALSNNVNTSRQVSFKPGDGQIQGNLGVIVFEGITHEVIYNVGLVRGKTWKRE